VGVDGRTNKLTRSPFGWLDLRLGSCLVLSLPSSNELGNSCYGHAHDSIINPGVIIIIIQWFRQSK